MNGKFFEKKVAKFGFVAFALALGLAACGDGGSTNGPANNHEGANVSSVESEDDLPNCTENREGFARFIDGTKEGFVCKDRKWVHYDMIADIDDNLPGCTGSREGLSAYLYEEDRELNCVDGSWDVVGEVATSSSSVILSDSEGSSSSSVKSSSSVASSSSVTSSSSVASSSSSSVIPGTDPGSPSSSSEKDDSSSSVAPNSSSSVILSDSEGSSSSSVKSSSSVASSSSVTSSSSVASSSSTSVPGSSSSVIPGTDPESSSDEAVDLSYATKCPAGHTCTYAPTEYLNSKVTYGELLDERDYQMYKTVEICDKNDKNCQTWMAQNLNYAPTNVSSMGSYAWSGCYGDVSANCSKYGRLYTWEVAMDNADCAGKMCNASLKPATPVRGVCPQGWHLPSHYEFEKLINFIDPDFGYNHTDGASSSKSGLYLKSQSGWNTSGNGSNTYGFSALPAGFRDDNGYFYSAGNDAFFWSASENDGYYVYYLDLYYYYDRALLSDYGKNYALSVRCVQN